MGNKESKWISLVCNMKLSNKAIMLAHLFIIILCMCSNYAVVKFVQRNEELPEELTCGVSASATLASNDSISNTLHSNILW